MNVSAHDIFREVQEEVPNLKATGQLQVPIIRDEYHIPTTDDMLTAGWKEEGEITVEYGGQSINVPCLTTSKDEQIARAIMHGFAQIVLNKKAIENYTEDDTLNEQETIKLIKNTVNETLKKQVIRSTESDLHRIVKESVNRIISESIGNGLSNEFKEEMRKYYQSKGWSEEQIKGMFNDIVDNFINRGYTEEDFANLWRIRYYQDKQKKLDEILDKIYREYACWNSKTNNMFKIEAMDKENLMNGVGELKKYGYEPIKITKGSEIPYGGRASYKVDVWYAYYERTV